MQRVRKWRRDSGAHSFSMHTLQILSLFKEHHDKVLHQQAQAMVKALKEPMPEMLHRRKENARML